MTGAVSFFTAFMGDTRFAGLTRVESKYVVKRGQGPIPDNNAPGGAVFPNFVENVNPSAGNEDFEYLANWASTTAATTANWRTEVVAQGGSGRFAYEWELPAVGTAAGHTPYSDGPVMYWAQVGTQDYQNTVTCTVTDTISGVVRVTQFALNHSRRSEPENGP